LSTVAAQQEFMQFRALAFFAMPARR